MFISERQQILHVQVEIFMIENIKIAISATAQSLELGFSLYIYARARVRVYVCVHAQRNLHAI